MLTPAGASPRLKDMQEGVGEPPTQPTPNAPDVPPVSLFASLKSTFTQNLTLTPSPLTPRHTLDPILSLYRFLQSLEIATSHVSRQGWLLDQTVNPCAVTRGNSLLSKTAPSQTPLALIDPDPSLTFPSLVLLTALIAHGSTHDWCFLLFTALLSPPPTDVALATATADATNVWIRLLIATTQRDLAADNATTDPSLPPEPRFVLDDDVVVLGPVAVNGVRRLCELWDVECDDGDVVASDVPATYTLPAFTDYCKRVMTAKSLGIIVKGLGGEWGGGEGERVSCGWDAWQECCGRWGDPEGPESEPIGTGTAKTPKQAKNTERVDADADARGSADGRVSVGGRSSAASVPSEKFGSTGHLQDFEITEVSPWGGVGGIDGRGPGEGLLYVVEKGWWESWEKYAGWEWKDEDTASSNAAAAAAAAAADTIPVKPGEICNHILIDTTTPAGTKGSYELLKPDLVLNEDYVAVPPPVWDILYELYGGGPPLCRPVTAPDPAAVAACATPRGRADSHDQYGNDFAVRVPRLPSYLKIKTHPTVIQVIACDPAQPYRRGWSGNFAIFSMVLPDQPMWRLFGEIVSRLGVHRTSDEKGRSKARLWIDSKKETPDSQRFGPWSFLAKGSCSFNLTSSSITKQLTKYWSTNTVSQMKIKNGDRLMIEYCTHDAQKKTWIWPRLAATASGEKSRLEEEDRVFKSFCRGYDESNNPIDPERFLNSKVDVMDNKGRWWRALIVDYELAEEPPHNKGDDEQTPQAETSDSEEPTAANPVHEPYIKRLELLIPDYSNRRDWISSNSEALAPLGRYTYDEIEETGDNPDESDLRSDDAGDSCDLINNSKPQLKPSKTQKTKFRRGSRGSKSYTSRQQNDDESVREDNGVCMYPGFGACGLANLGNTCYANAALQCLSYMPLMRGYILGKQYLRNDDLNRDNPLGAGGVLLEGYAELQKQLWSGKQGYLVPSEFRRMLGKCNGQFSTNEQQDSQELLAWLLDMLHEDGNRVKNKPMVPPIEDAWMDANTLPRIALEAWRRYLRRNRSVVSSLCFGQIYNMVTCPVCNKTSSSFDPFSMLSVPIPTVSEMYFRVTVYRRISKTNMPGLVGGDAEDGEFVPPSQNLIAEQYAISVPKLSDAGYLKLQLQNLSGISRERLTLCELMDDNREIDEKKDAAFQQFFAAMELDDKDPCSKILSKDKTVLGEGNARTTRLVCYESTVSLKRAEIEFDSNEMMSKLEQEQGGYGNESDSDALERRNGELDDVYTLLYNQEFLTLYSSADEGRVWDTDVLAFMKAQAESRWPKSSADMCDRLIGLRLDYLDEQRTWVQASVVAVEREGKKGGGLDCDDEDAAGSVRVHFDRYASKWDKVLPLSTFGSRRVMPLHTHSQPKSVVCKLNMYHRFGNRLFGAQQFFHYQHEWTTCRSFAAALVCVSKHVAEGKVVALVNTLVDILLAADSRYLETMNDKEKWEGWDNRMEEKTLRKSVRQILKQLPFKISVASISNPVGKEEESGESEMEGEEDSERAEVRTNLGGDKEEEEFDFSLSRCIGNCANPRLCVVISWAKKGAFTNAGIHIHERSEMEVREKESKSPAVEKEEEGGGVGGLGGGGGKGEGEETGDGRKVSLHECLQEYCKAQTLSINDFWCCSSCKDIREGEQSMSLWRLPDIMTIHLKRFNCSERWKEKITTRVDFPVTGLDMSQHVDSRAPAQENVYDLFGVINHLGGIHGGHYIAFAKATACEGGGAEEVAHTFNGAMASGCVPVEAKVEENLGGTGGFFSIGKRKKNGGGDGEGGRGEAGRKEAEKMGNFVRTSAEPFWVALDDDTAEPLTTDRIITDSAYVLFYRRRRLSPALVASMANF